MARVITFSRVFPAYHPRKGEPTYFVEQFLNSTMPIKKNKTIERNDISKYVLPFINDFVLLDGSKKHHTIRQGNRFKAGDFFSPRIWSGKPYKSKQIIIAPDTEIKKNWTIELNQGVFIIDGKPFSKQQSVLLLRKLSKNDGFNMHIDLLNWFQYPKPFKGQIICWNENITYP